jgi:hypothetical protein
MNDELLAGLAAALGVEPEAVLEYSPEAGGGYCVILETFQKRHNVKPRRIRRSRKRGQET